MFEKYVRFLRGVSINKVGLVGVVLTTSSFVTFIILELARIIGVFTSAYAGLVTYLLFPAVFILGLVLIPIGWYLRKKDTGLSGKELLAESFADPDTKIGFFGSTVFRTIVIFTLINITFMTMAGSRMLNFMDTPRFCGTACHSVMNPEWVTYQDSPHARVACVECHVGEGVGALIDSKINGTWQMISVTFDLLQRPIPTPVHQLRPARETCEKCHWPDKFYGGRLRTIVHYGNDSASTPAYTTLNLKVDAGKVNPGGGIHWHVSEQNEIRYASVDDLRETMIWVERKLPDGSYKRYRNANTNEESVDEDQIRTLDCIDCHNRATHIYKDPHDAVNEAIRLGLLNRSLPYIKREAVAALTKNYADSVSAMEGISNGFEGFYRLNYPALASTGAARLDSAVAALTKIYYRNVHHGMNIKWGTYPSQIGHRYGTGSGCFRCHNESMVDDSGKAVSSDCTLCHSILAFDYDKPFGYIETADTTNPEYQMQQYLRDEFLKSISE